MMETLATIFISQPVLSIRGVALAAFGTLLLWLACSTFYNLFFHPLGLQYPGPAFAQASVLYQVYHELTGQMPHTLTRLHKQYGPIVRIGPNELSFNDTQALQEIYGRQKQGRYSSFLKDPTFYGPGANNTPSILICSDEDHKRFRQLLNHAFTSKAVLTQEKLLTSHVNKLIEGLTEKINQVPSVNLTLWFDSFGLDVISDLTYGKPFGCLDAKGEPTRETSIIAGSLKASTWYRAIRRMPSLVQILTHALLPSKAKKIRQARIEYSTKKIHERMDRDIDRPDVYWHISNAEEKKTMSAEEIASSLSILMAAGSETTATTLTGCVYLLLRNPGCLEKLRAEIVENFSSEEDICLAGLYKCRFLSAVLSETMRLYPPTPSTLPRRVPEGGATVCNRRLPGGVIVGVNHWVINRSMGHFEKATEFAPERWLEEDYFPKDDKAAFKPFMLGVRNCVGQRLADAELRLAIARLLWSFDLVLVCPDEDWMMQDAYTLWAKKPLRVTVSRREG